VIFDALLVGFWSALKPNARGTGNVRERHIRCAREHKDVFSTKSRSRGGRRRNEEETSSRDEENQTRVHDAELPRKPTEIFPVRARVFAFERVQRDARKRVVRFLDEKIFTGEGNRGSDGVFETDRTSFDEEEEEEERRIN
jgi:hypothetical protein